MLYFWLRWADNRHEAKNEPKGASVNKSTLNMMDESVEIVEGTPTANLLDEVVDYFASMPHRDTVAKVTVTVEFGSGVAATYVTVPRKLVAKNVTAIKPGELYPVYVNDQLAAHAVVSHLTIGATHTRIFYVGGGFDTRRNDDIATVEVV